MKTKIANLRRLDILGNADCSSHREILTAMLKQWRQKLGYCSIFAAVPALLASHISEARPDEGKKPEVSVAGRRERFLERLNLSCSNPALLKRQSEYLLPHQKGSFDLLAALGGNDDCPGRTIPGGPIPPRRLILTPAILPVRIIRLRAFPAFTTLTMPKGRTMFTRLLLLVAVQIRRYRFQQHPAHTDL